MGKRNTRPEKPALKRRPAILEIPHLPFRTFNRDNFNNSKGIVPHFRFFDLLTDELSYACRKNTPKVRKICENEVIARACIINETCHNSRQEYHNLSIDNE